MKVDYFSRRARAIVVAIGLLSILGLPAAFAAGSAHPIPVGAIGAQPATVHFGVTDDGCAGDESCVSRLMAAGAKAETPKPATPEMDESALIGLVKSTTDPVTLYTQIGNPEVLVKTGKGTFSVIVGDMSRLRALSEQNDAHVILHTAKPEAPTSPGLANWPLSTWVPILISLAFLTFLGFRIWQQRQGGGGGFFGSAAKGNMSKSKAKRVDNVPDRLSDICGQENAKRDVTEVIDFLRDPSRFAENGAKIPNTVLLIGPPGNGKTKTARAIAGEAGVPFFHLSGSDFVEMFVGVGAARARDLFEEAKKEGTCIIFIDEVDAVAKRRGGTSGNDERDTTLNQLLVQLEGFEAIGNVVIICATNLVDMLDPAFISRMHLQVTVDHPDIMGREALLSFFSKKFKVQAEIHSNIKRHARACSGFSGRDLEKTFNRAAVIGSRRPSGQRAVTSKDLDEAILERAMGAAKSSVAQYMLPESRRLLSVHEVGHWFMSMLAGRKPARLTIMPRGNSGGHYQAEEVLGEVCNRKDQVIEMIRMLVGAHAAETVVFGEDKTSTGVSADLQMANDLAYNMVAKWGMTKEFGLIAVKDNENIELTNPEMAKQITRLKKAILDEAHAYAVARINEHRVAFEYAATRISEEETMLGHDLEALWEMIMSDQLPKKNEDGGSEPKAQVPNSPRRDNVVDLFRGRIASFVSKFRRKSAAADSNSSAGSAAAFAVSTVASDSPAQALEVLSATQDKVSESKKAV